MEDSAYSTVPNPAPGFLASLAPGGNDENYQPLSDTPSGVAKKLSESLRTDVRPKSDDCPTPIGTLSGCFRNPVRPKSEPCPTFPVLLSDQNRNRCPRCVGIRSLPNSMDLMAAIWARICAFFEAVLICSYTASYTTSKKAANPDGTTNRSCTHAHRPRANRASRNAAAAPT